MTSEEALAGVREVQRHFGRQYKGADLNAIWPELLGLPVLALHRAVGVIKLNCSRFPDAAYLLGRVKDQAAGSVEVADDERDEGKEILALFRAKIEGTLSTAEYARAMYLCADKYHRPAYAAIARQAEEKVG